MPFYQQVIWAVISVMVFFFLFPTAKKWIKGGPRGSSAQWINFAVIIAAVFGFVALLVIMLKS